MADQTVNKFVIRNSIKELQSRQTFSSLEELAEAVNEDLFSEGFALGPEERAKISQIVNDEGYTGRFAIDDILRRKFKNKKWLPVVSLISAVGLFFLTTAVAAVVEHYIQRPLEGDNRKAPLAAVFQVPETVGKELRFKVRLTNLSDKPLTNVVLFASADGVAKQISVDRIDSSQSRDVEGLLDLTKSSVSEVDFVAYVIAGDFSLSSQPTRVARDFQYLAMLDSSELDSRGPGAKRSTQNSMTAAPPVLSKAQALETNAPPGAKPVAQPAQPARPAVSGRTASATDGPTTDVLEVSSFRTVASNQLASDQEIERLAQKNDALSRQLLEAYAASGHEQARRLLAK